jgi:outer membrane protein OmpA-like peptidoglycan-associated protein
MKGILVAAFVALGIALSTSAFAQAYPQGYGWWNGFEAGVQGGYGWGTSSGTFTGPLGRLPQYSFHTYGGMGGGHLGYDWEFPPNWVLGLEGDLEGGDISGLRRHPVAPTAGIGSSMDFDSSIRGRVGWAFGQTLLYGTGGVAFGDVTTHYNQPIGVRVAGNSETRVGWTAGAGLAYALTPNWETNVEYRYTDLGSETQSFPRIRVTDSNKFTYNMIRVGLTYRFAPPPPPPPIPPTPPVVAPAPLPRVFLVFFDFDRYNLTPDARRVIEAAAQTYKATGSARLDVSGYTDLAGTQAYNLRLSRRRADAVAAYMVRLGVPRNVMDVKWFGKENPRVPTPDGVREPQNRRVEIEMH